MTDSLPPSQERFAGSDRINALIHICLHYLSDQDKRRFIAQFRNLPQDSDQMMHTLRELVLGAYLASTGIAVRYQAPIDGKTPDWSLFKEGRPAGYIDLLNFHIDKETETQIEDQQQSRGAAAYWRDGNKDNATRLFHALQK